MVGKTVGSIAVFGVARLFLCERAWKAVARLHGNTIDPLLTTTHLCASKDCSLGSQSGACLFGSYPNSMLCMAPKITLFGGVDFFFGRISRNRLVRLLFTCEQFGSETTSGEW